MVEVKELESAEEWQSVKETSKDNKELIVFKYSPICTISFVANKYFEKWMREIPEDKEIIIAKVNVISERTLSREIAAEFNIKHESPQVIWLDENGNVKWHGSHHRITDKSLNARL